MCGTVKAAKPTKMICTKRALNMRSGIHTHAATVNKATPTMGRSAAPKRKPSVGGRWGGALGTDKNGAKLSSLWDETLLWKPLRSELQIAAFEDFGHSAFQSKSHAGPGESPPARKNAPSPQLTGKTSKTGLILAPFGTDKL